ncbi:MAG: hypothetical protein ABR585_00600 [Gemmatimonadaceae bacterium]
MLIRQDAFEQSGTRRESIDRHYNLTDAEFRVEDGIVAIGPLPADDMLSDLIQDLEASGLAYFDDFFELSGNWPAWLALYARNQTKFRR